MKNLDILNSKETKRIKQIIKDQWDTDHPLDYAFLQNKEGDIFIINKDVQNIDTEKLRINTIGLYFGQIKNEEIRLSIDAAQLIGKTAKKNILNINDEQLKRYLKGEDVEIDNQDTKYMILKNKEDIFGTARVKNNILLNFYPKARRINIE